MNFESLSDRINFDKIDDCYNNYCSKCCLWEVIQEGCQKQQCKSHNYSSDNWRKSSLCSSSKIDSSSWKWSTHRISAKETSRYIWQSLSDQFLVNWYPLFGLRSYSLGDRNCLHKSYQGYHHSCDKKCLQGLDIQAWRCERRKSTWYCTNNASSSCQMFISDHIRHYRAYDDSHENSR